jgi:hypothetical protein
VLALAMNGCGGSGGGASKGSPVTVRETGTFYSNENDVLLNESNLVIVGRSFITLNQRVPTVVGVELTPQALRDLPIPDFNQKAVYGINLPAESASTPYTYTAFHLWGGHTPTGVGDRPHFHVVFGVSPPQQPLLPDPFQAFRDADPTEVPADHVKQAGPDARDTALGVVYADPSEPHLQNGWNSTGYDYFFYNGHMGSVQIAATKDFLLRQSSGQQAEVSGAIKQPQVYPKPGSYPTRYRVRYDAGRKVHVFTLEDFQPAGSVVAQRVR